MKQDDRDWPLESARQLVQRLHALVDTQAPSTLLQSVLAARHRDAYFQLDAPVGPVYVAYNDVGISMVSRVACADDFERAFLERFGRPVAPTSQPPNNLRDALVRAAQGERRVKLRFDLATLSEFEQAVLRKTLEIPHGEVRPYAWIAREIGHPRAVRAVGTALAHNPIPFLIPCHRVVRSDGHLGNYSMGGVEAKRVMLAAEGVTPDELEALAQAGVRYIGSDTTHVYCYPTCRGARRITSAHRQTFRSEAEAAAAGYRPCQTCRPPARDALRQLGS